MGFIGALTVTIKKSYHPKLFVLSNPLIFETDEIRVEVPTGFETDLASIPWFARWIFTRAHSSAYAAVIHDYLYDTGMTRRDVSDRLFFEALADPVCNTNVLSRWVMWAGVRVGGWRGWARSRRNDQHFQLTHLFGLRADDPLFTKEPHVREFKVYEGFQKPKRHVHTVYLHCSATDNPRCDNPHFIYKVHVKENKWADVGYHYFINKAGIIYECRPLEKTPAAQAPFNRGSIAICLSGLKKGRFSPAQFQALRSLSGDIDHAYGGEMKFKGHCEVSPKTCPVFNYKKVLRLDSNGRIKDGVPTVKKLEASGSQHMKAAKKRQTDGDVGVGVGGGAIAVGVGSKVVDVTQSSDPLKTLKHMADKATEFKSLAIKAGEVMSWLLTLEGFLMAGGAMLAFWGWRMWANAKAMKQARLKEEPTLKRLVREAAETYS